MTSDEEWSAILATNLTSAFCFLRAATKAMQRTGGSIVLVSSAAASIGLTNHEAIAAAKGVAALAVSAGATYASRASNGRNHPVYQGCRRPGCNPAAWVRGPVHTCWK